MLAGIELIQKRKKRQYGVLRKFGRYFSDIWQKRARGVQTKVQQNRTSDHDAACSPPPGTARVEASDSKWNDVTGATALA